MEHVNAIYPTHFNLNSFGVSAGIDNVNTENLNVTVSNNM